MREAQGGLGPGFAKQSNPRLHSPSYLEKLGQGDRCVAGVPVATGTPFLLFRSIGFCALSRQPGRLGAVSTVTRQASLLMKLGEPCSASRRQHPARRPARISGVMPRVRNERL
jgi:hypothetical protein